MNYLEETLIHQLIIEAQQDNQAAREKLILAYRGQIAAASSKVCGRPLDWNNDDELSIGLIAFNEAINAYNPSLGKSFWNYAQIVIHNRLVDYFRREANWKQRVGSMQTENGTDKQEYNHAVEQYQHDEEAKDQAEMVAHFQAVLSEYKITINDLIKDSPKHCDTKTNLMRSAIVVKENPGLLQKLLHTKQLPVKELVMLTGLSRKMIESGRRYIIALVVILVNEEFLLMRSLIKFPVEGR